jgi:hypothetical protein
MPAVSGVRWAAWPRPARAGALFAAGWLLAKLLRVVGTAIAAALVGVGWLAARALWPALCWCGRAVRLGWEQGKKPGMRGAG